MSHYAEIDESACAAHGDCTEIAPDVFEVDEVARVVGTSSEEVLIAAAEACPSAAIRIIDQRTNQQVYP